MRAHRDVVPRSWPTETARRRRPAFSLLEMMIAIVILGLGLIMVATMFPIAWKRARVLTEYTSQIAVTEAAKTTIELLTRVDGLQPTATSRQLGSFAGDLIFEDTNKQVIVYSDTRVHALHLENMLVDASPREFVPDRVDPWSASYSPSQLERVGEPPVCEPPLDPLPPPLPRELYCVNTPSPCGDLFYSAQVRFESRVYPPMPTQQTVNENGVFPTALSPEDILWFDALDTRRYAWAVFHRLREATQPDEPCTGDFSEVAEKVREFDVYYVTLKRSQSTVRYARQNADPANTPDFEWPNREVPVAPVALGPEDDVLLPSPWRVQVLFPIPDNPPTSIPTEIEVNRGDGKTDVPFVVDMFQVGTQCIDELNGLVYRVNQRRLVGDDLDQAFLTLDREILLEDIDDGYDDAGCPNNALVCNTDNKTLEDEELLRTVWVFPPPVLAERVSDDPVFVGKQPVLSIERGTLSRSPAR